MKIKLALELPSCALKHLGRHSDLDFAIAYRVLEDERYAEHYRLRGTRELILDNGFHELGKPASWDTLLEAAKRVQPDYIIVPDNHGPYDAIDNFAELQRAADIVPPEKLAFVVAGMGNNRTHTVHAAMTMGVGVLCFSRMVPRLQWYRELRSRLPELIDRRIHLLGISTLPELEAWQETGHLGEISTDTSKPAKAALLGRTLDDGEPLRGMPVVSKTLFEQPMDITQMQRCQYNIRLLQAACGGE